MKTLRMWSSSMQHVGPFMDANKRTVFSTLQVASEREYIRYLYTRASENPSEKSVKFLERGPGGEPLPAAWALKIDGF